MSFNCTYCGTECKEVDGKKVCPNHGVVEDEINDEPGKRNYIG